jgi:1-acyl-sn-glycerol-3-phosphate acyltransferase
MSDTAADRWGRSTEQALQAGLFRAAYERWFRVTWEGLEHIPTDGGALLVANHAGMMPVDGGIVQYGIESECGRDVYPLAHSGFWRVPFIGRMLSRSGAVVGHPRNADQLLRDGHLVLVFPEGAKGPVKDADQYRRLQRFGRGGFVASALQAGVPIIPVVLAGTEDTTPTVATFRAFGQQVPISWNTLLLGPVLGAVAHLPAKISVRVLSPVESQAPPDRDHYPQSLLMDQAEGIRSGMQTALDSMYLARESTWKG